MQHERGEGEVVHPVDVRGRIAGVTSPRNIKAGVRSYVRHERESIVDSLRRRAADLLAAVGVPAGGRAVAPLSRGEQQRVAIARALLREPPIPLALACPIG